MFGELCKKVTRSISVLTHNNTIKVIVCSELEEGFMLMLVGNSQRHHQAYTSVANSIEVPLINWDMSPALMPGNSQVK